MNRYWLSRMDGAAAEGPFGETLLQAMWERGEIQAGQQLCLEHTEDWRPADEVLSEMMELQRAETRRGQAQQRMELFRTEAQARLAKERKSAAVAFLVSFVLPGMGHGYCGRWGMAALFAVTSIALSLTAGPVIWLAVGLLSGAAGIAAVGRYNRELATRLGL